MMAQNGPKSLKLADFGLFQPILDDFEGLIKILSSDRTPNICTCLESSLRALSNQLGGHKMSRRTQSQSRLQYFWAKSSGNVPLAVRHLDKYVNPDFSSRRLEKSVMIFTGLRCNFFQAITHTHAYTNFKIAIYTHNTHTHSIFVKNPEFTQI